MTNVLVDSYKMLAIFQFILVESNFLVDSKAFAKGEERTGMAIRNFIRGYRASPSPLNLVHLCISIEDEIFLLDV